MNNYINHIALVLDASYSMKNAAPHLIKVAENQVAYLAQRSKELDQETRVTLYSFADTVTCLCYDKDVLRLPSITDLYKVKGNTALIDATLQAIDDLAKTPELYGEHAFLTYVLTDGEENHSARRPLELTTRLARLPEHWTVAVFVPNQTGVFEAKKFGFPKDNIAVWDATSAKGVEAAGETIRQTTENFMVARSKGVRGYRNLFSLETVALTTAAAKLQQLHRGQYRLLDVPDKVAIAPFVEKTTGRAYKLGEAYYQLSKPEKIQPQKALVIYDLKKHCAYVGDNARTLLGLPDKEVRVSPTAHPDYQIFVQSTSVNRNLVAGTRLLLLSGAA